MPDEIIPTDEQIIPDLPSDTPTDVVKPESDVSTPDNVGVNVPEPTIEKKVISLGETTSRIQNLAIADFIKNNANDDSDLAATKKALIDNLTIDNEVDNAITRLEKQFNLFLLMGLPDLATVFGIPTEVYEEKVAYKPQLKLLFRERVINPDDLPLRNQKLERELSFRFMGANVPTTKADLDDLKARIIAAFIPYKWTVSPIYEYHYRDPANGYRLGVNAEIDMAREILTKFVALQGDNTFDEGIMTESKHGLATTKTATYFGETVTLPKKGRYGDIYLHTATYYQFGIKPIKLVDPLIYFNENG